MKKYAILLFSALFMFSLTTNAQDQNTRKKNKKLGTEARVEKMSTDLGLSDTDKAKVKTLLEKQAVELKSFYAENNKEDTDYKTKLKTLKKAQSTEMKALVGEGNDSKQHKKNKNKNQDN